MFALHKFIDDHEYLAMHPNPRNSLFLGSYGRSYIGHKNTASSMHEEARGSTGGTRGTHNPMSSLNIWYC